MKTSELLELGLTYEQAERVLQLHKKERNVFRDACMMRMLQHCAANPMRIYFFNGRAYLRKLGV